MKTTIKIFLLALLAMTFITTSCSKDGETGPAGIAGTNGQDGTNGTDGNANVLVETFELVNEDWLWQGYYSFRNSSWFTRFHDLVVPQIDADIDENGLVLMYLKGTADGGWQSFPFQFPTASGAFNTNINYESSVGKIRLHYYFSGGTGSLPFTLQNYDIPSLSFKYVIISGNVSGKNSEISIVDLKKMSHNDVMDYLGLDY